MAAKTSTYTMGASFGLCCVAVLGYDAYAIIIIMKSGLGRKGFTIVELLIVIVVIAILATITIVAYNGVVNRANESAIKGDISSMRKLMEISKIELGRYPENVTEFRTGFKFNKSVYDQTQNNVYYILNISTQQYSFGLRLAGAKKGYFVTDQGTREVTAVSGALTASEIGLSAFCAGDPNLRCIQGYAITGSVWTSSWPWTS